MNIVIFLKNILLFKILFSFITNLFNYPLKNYYKIIHEMRLLDIWDPRLNNRINHFNIDLGNGFNNLYGILHSLKYYSGLDSKMPRIIVQHGLFLAGYEPAFHYKYVRKAVVMSNEMSERLTSLESNKEVIAVGPYIIYAPDYYSKEKLQYLKNKFGKTLLVFIPHSIEKKKNKNIIINQVYNEENIIDVLIKRYNDYDTFLINGFSGEENLSFDNRLLDKRVIKTYSGNPHDYNFLSRQKSIIQLADHSISFVVSTHIGYCLSLGLSHEIVNIFGKSKWDITNKSYLNQLEFSDELTDANLDELIANYPYLKGYQNNEDEILHYFFNTGNSITQDQLNLINRFWGLNNIKTPEEIRLFLN